MITDAVSLRSLAGISSDPVALFVSNVLRKDSTSCSVMTISLIALGQTRSAFDAVCLYLNNLHCFELLSNPI